MSRETFPLPWLTVADDVTGAGEAAAVFARPGKPVPVAVVPDAAALCGSFPNGLVIGTASRDLDAEGWERCWSRWEASLTLLAPRLPMVKIDSLLRGHWSDDIRRIARLLHVDQIVLAPALPDQDRVVVGGQVRWHGRPLEATEVSGQIRSSTLADYFPSSMSVRVWAPGEAIGLDDHPLLIADAWSDKDLDELVDRIVVSGRRVLWAGTRGLLSSLARRSGAGTGVVQLPHALPRLPVLVLAGSQTAMAKAQMQHLSQMWPVLRLNPSGGLDLPRLTGLRALAVTSQGMEGTNLTADMIFERWVGAVQELMQYPWSAVIATGGETALAFLTAVEASGVRVWGLALSGSVAGSVWGGPTDGMTIVTKSGSFGVEDTLTRLLDFLDPHEGN